MAIRHSNTYLVAFIQNADGEFRFLKGIPMGKGPGKPSSTAKDLPFPLRGVLCDPGTGAAVRVRGRPDEISILARQEN